MGMLLAQVEFGGFAGQPFCWLSILYFDGRGSSLLVCLRDSESCCVLSYL